MSTGIFSQVSFAEGRFRRAYKGIWTAPPSIAGREIVVKECKANYTWSPSDWKTTEKIYSKAQQSASIFNCKLYPNYINPNYSIQYTEFKVCQVTKSSGAGPQLYEYVAVEDFIPGQFTKWCDNYGYISQGAKSVDLLMPAFVHHSWSHSVGQIMVGDLQGVRNYNGSQYQYQLTDPAILSTTGEYGPTDMGIEGMAMFFLNHECNNFCTGLRRPTLQHLEEEIPSALLAQCTALQQQVGNATRYTWEMKFPPDLKKTVIDLFTRIAQGEPV